MFGGPSQMSFGFGFGMTGSMPGMGMPGMGGMGMPGMGMPGMGMPGMGMADMTGMLQMQMMTQMVCQQQMQMLAQIMQQMAAQAQVQMQACMQQQQQAYAEALAAYQKMAAQQGAGGGAAPLTGGGGGGGALPTGPVSQGTAGLLQHANAMVGLQENRDRAAIQKVTGRSGINPATTPWCAAWAMNLLEQHGVLKLDGLSNRNYCPTIKQWGMKKDIWGEHGRYQPKPGDAILFDWNKDGTPDHIGIVEKVANGKVYTIEGNSSDSVKKNTYAIGDGRIDGYLKT